MNRAFAIANELTPQQKAALSFLAMKGQPLTNKDFSDARINGRGGAGWAKALGPCTKPREHDPASLWARGLVTVTGREYTLTDLGREVAATLPPCQLGSTVEVTGCGTFDESGKLRKVDSVTEVGSDSMDPVPFLSFEHDNKHYRLKEAINLHVENSDDHWIYSYPALSLWGVGERREDALRDLNANFDYIYREFALEQDSALDTKAQKIKRTLLAIMESTEDGGAHANEGL